MIANRSTYLDAFTLMVRAGNLGIDGLAYLVVSMEEIDPATFTELAYRFTVTDDERLSWYS